MFSHEYCESFKNFRMTLILLICFHFGNLRCHNGIPLMDIIEIFSFAKIKKIVYITYFEQKIKKKKNYSKNIIENLINIEKCQ